MMNQATQPTYTDDVQTLLGTFFIVGANQTPFIDRMGGLSAYKQVFGTKFPVSVYAALETATQRAVDEADQVSGAGAHITYTRAQAYNYIQTLYRLVNVSYEKLANAAVLSGIAWENAKAELVSNEIDTQTRMNLLQMAIDTEYSIFQGVAQAPTNNATAAKSAGFVGTGANGAIQTNRINGGTTEIDKGMIKACVKSMADHGAPFIDPVLYCGSYVKEQLSEIYGWSPIGAAGTGVGGVNVEVIQTNFAKIPVVFDPFMLSTAVAIVEMAEVKLAGLEVPGMGAVYLEQLSKTGMAEKYHVFSKLGLDYGEESHHGCIYEVLDAAAA